MKCRTFRIRLSHPDAGLDEAALAEFLGKVKVSHLNSALVQGPDPYWSVLVFYEETPTAGDPYEEIRLTPGETRVYQALRAWRAEQALLEDVSPRSILGDRALKEIVKTRARSREELAKIKGMDEGKVARYAEEIIGIMVRF